MSKPNLTQLRDQINHTFNEEELRDLCFELGVEHDSLGGRGKAANVRELITYCQRRHLLPELRAALVQARPALEWSALLPPATLPASPAQQQAWQAATQIYLDKLYAQVNWLHVLGKPEGQPLEYIYTDVNVLDKLSAEKRYSLEQLQDDFVPRQGWRMREKERRDGLEVVAEHPRLFILGKPGAGKTSFLKHVAVQTIKHYRQGEGAHKLPIFVSLKELSDAGLAIVPFMAEQFRRANFAKAEAFVRQLLQNGDAVVLFDGLDEVNVEAQQRANMTRDIQSFVDEFDRCRVLVTCRLAAADYVLKRFEYVEMADFSEAQQQIFVFRWFQADRVARDACWQALLGVHNKTLRELAQVPILLSLLCLTFEERKEFPPNRDEIYSEATRALLLKWDTDRNIQRDKIYETLTLKHKERLLARVAAETFGAGEYFVKGTRLAKLIEGYLEGVPGVADCDGLEVLQQIEAQHGLLVERAHGIYSFSHLTLQEYFSARYIVDNEARGSLPRLMVHVGDDRWREVFLLTAGMLEDATGFCQQYLATLAKMVAGDKTLLAILKWVVYKSTQVQSGLKPPPVRAFTIFLALTLNFALDLDLVLDLALDLVLDLALDLAPDLDLDLALDLAFDPDLVRALALDLAVSGDLSLLVSLPQTTAEIISYLQMWTGGKGLIVLNQALKRLIVPEEAATRELWQRFNQQLEAIILVHWGLDAFWELSQELPMPRSGTTMNENRVDKDKAGCI